MKKINLNGIAQILSERELMNIVGGVLPKKLAEEEPIGTDSCETKLPWAKCSITWSGGTSSGQCVLGSNDKWYCKIT